MDVELYNIQFLRTHHLYAPARIGKIVLCSRINQFYSMCKSALCRNYIQKID